MTELPKSHQEAAERELNEAQREEALPKLRELIPKAWEGWMQWLHPNPDVVMVWYLRWAKYDVQKAFKRMESTDKHLKDPLIGPLEAITPESCKAFWDQGMLRFLPGQAAARSGAVVCLLLPMKMTQFEDPAVMLRWNVWTLKRAMRDPDPNLQVYGQVIVEDFYKFSLMQTMRMQMQLPSHIMKFSMQFMQECAPFRLKGIVLVKQPVYVTILFAMIKPFMSAKMKSRIVMVGHDLEALDAIVDLKLLPPGFAGIDPAQQQGGAAAAAATTEGGGAAGVQQQEAEDWFARQVRLDAEGK